MSEVRNTQSILRMRRFLTLPILVGCVSVVISTAWLGWTAIFVMTTIEAPGKVLAVDRDPSEAWTATFTFTDNQGVVHQLETSRQSPSTYLWIRKGDDVTALYHPTAPQDAEINSFATLWFTPLLIFSVGLFFVIVGGGMAFSLRWIKTRIDPANADDMTTK